MVRPARSTPVALASVARAAGRVVQRNVRRCAWLPLLWLAACGGQMLEPTSVAGDAAQGRLLLRQFGCASCHRIPGIRQASGAVGPPLDAIAHRVYLGGVLPNTPEDMVRWIRAPQRFDPSTAMPDLGVTEAQARAMVAYLYRLR
jgi:cytochrome c2